MLCFLLVVAMGNEAFAQLSKKEKKEWKKKQKKMDPEEFKNLLEDNNALQSQVNTLKSQMTSLQSRVSDKDSKISQLQTELKRSESKLEEALKDESLDISPNQTKSAKGVVFKVQIGAFKNKNLEKFLANSENMTEETLEDMKQYTLGNFVDYWEADTFKKYLREMGVKDAWIVPFKDGQRVPMKDVLEGII